MQLLRVTFAAPFAEPHLSIDCWPPFVDLNMLFMAGFKAYVEPYKLAIDAGVVTEETATLMLAKAYAEGVLAKSPTKGFESWRPAQWEAWLLKHPDHFSELRAHLEVRRNWEDPGAADGADQHA